MINAMKDGNKICDVVCSIASNICRNLMNLLN